MRQARYVYEQSGILSNVINDSGVEVKVGDVMPLTEGIGVWQQTVPNGENGVVYCKGQWALPVELGFSPDVGVVVYWDAVGEQVVASGLGNTRAGVVVPGHDLASTEVCVDIGM